MSYKQALGVSPGDVASAATAVVTDPCLGPLTRHVLELKRIAEKPSRKPGRPSKPSKGIGLCHAITPVRAFTFHVKNPWFVPAAVVALGGVLYWAGYAVGRRRR